MLTFAVIWMSISCIISVLSAGMNIAKDNVGMFIMQMIDATAYGFVIYTLLTCCK